jgi:hypothetical protein
MDNRQSSSGGNLVRASVGVASSAQIEKKKAKLSRSILLSKTGLFGVRRKTLAVKSTMEAAYTAPA